jgi:hypothetical protein
MGEMASVKAGQQGEEPRIWEIYDEPNPFRIIAWSAEDAAMEWLAWKEKNSGDKVWVPSLILGIHCLSDPEQTRYMLIVGALRMRDRERRRCGLPPFWEPIAQYLEAHQMEAIKRIAEKARMAEEDGRR